MRKKRLADWLEKMSAGCFVGAIISEKLIGVVASLVLIGFSMALTPGERATGASPQGGNDGQG